jgi:hypothetical protein
MTLEVETETWDSKREFRRDKLLSSSLFCAATWLIAIVWVSRAATNLVGDKLSSGNQDVQPNSRAGRFPDCGQTREGLSSIKQPQHTREIRKGRSRPAAK